MHIHRRIVIDPVQVHNGLCGRQCASLSISARPCAFIYTRMEMRQQQFASVARLNVAMTVSKHIAVSAGTTSSDEIDLSCKTRSASRMEEKGCRIAMLSLPFTFQFSDCQCRTFAVHLSFLFTRLGEHRMAGGGSLLKLEKGKANCQLPNTSYD
jgi:hypothetical protein